MTIARKFAGSVDLAQDDQSGAVLARPDVLTALTCGAKTVAATATPERLVAASVPTARGVWVAARTNANGAAQNTKPVFLGDATTQAIAIMPTDTAGIILPIDPYKVYVKVGVNGEGVSYAILE